MSVFLFIVAEWSVVTTRKFHVITVSTKLPIATHWHFVERMPPTKDTLHWDKKYTAMLRGIWGRILHFGEQKRVEISQLCFVYAGDSQGMHAKRWSSGLALRNSWWEGRRCEGRPLPNQTVKPLRVLWPYQPKETKRCSDPECAPEQVRRGKGLQVAGDWSQKVKVRRGN